ncbi:hypothetical protein A2164_01605 [Candidatus Curtissbacteria bacterium RBG_13_35_7]|uniref:General secretion pathway GspH domain-containing protein n=1 Tax=Candidatus Curtissbacteria bacterium RBG_13_35_7 TaxID=1797705 RepID=A0A1F5G4E6_9BACT|nr:MAG: hypothetical protein A2164_01605 [Candidatus Curtissbacteria bacterium RBG_13_35_7]
MKGFTLIELMVVMAIFALITGFGALNLVNLQTKSSLAADVNTLVADIKEQQIKTMVGDMGGTASQIEFGVYFESNRYTLFQGTSYSSNPSNFPIDLSDNTTLTTSFPLSQLVFSVNSGEVLNFSAGSNQITVQDTINGDQKIITINRYGAILIN